MVKLDFKGQVCTRPILTSISETMLWMVKDELMEENGYTGRPEILATLLEQSQKEGTTSYR